MTSENKYLVDLTKQLMNMLNYNDSQLLKIIHDYILMDKSKLGKDDRSFYESLIANPEKDVRDMNGMILTYAVNRLFSLNNMELVDTLMNEAFALMADDLNKYWIKIH